MLDADAVGEVAFCQREESSAYDGGDHEAGAFAGELAETGKAEGEDAWEHDGVEEADGDDGEHGHIAGAEHGGDDEGAGDDGGGSEGLAGADAAEDGRADEAADHGSSPVEGDVVSCGLFAEAHDLREAEVVDEEAADGDFGSDIDEDADGRHDEVGMGPDAVCAFIGEFTGAEVAGEVGGGELEDADGDGKGEEHEGDAEVGQADSGGLLGTIVPAAWRRRRT